jgi:NAD(P)-dependent dehydrogenase (short-subunit alcohol dehydrogenase family)
MRQSAVPTPSSETMLLRDRVCLIVGAGSCRGIGYATAELFARHGARIAVVDVTMDDEIAEAFRTSMANANGTQPELIGLRCNIESYADCEQVISTVQQRLGPIDSLINCAGIVKAQGMLSILEHDYDRVLDVNLKGAFNLCKAMLAASKPGRRASIVNIASVAAQRGGGLVGGAHYAASKGGVISLTKTIAREFGPRGIRANVICPSMIDTAMLDGNLTREKFDEIVAAVPLQRAGLPADVAGACLFLASDLSAYVTGATIDVNGGSHIH